MGYNNDQIKVAMQKSGIPEQETIKLINYKPFYLRAWFFVPVILALIFAGLLGAFVLDEFVFISEPVNEIDLIEDEVVDDSSSTRTTTDEVVDDEDDETEVSCGDGVCDSDEDCALDCGCETDDECSVYGSYLCGSGGECYYTIGTAGDSSSSSSGGSSSSSSSSDSGTSDSGTSDTWYTASVCDDVTCSDGFVCYESTATCGCDSDDDCDEGFSCDEDLDGTCVEEVVDISCATDEDCLILGTAYACDTASGSCVACTESDGESDYLTQGTVTGINIDGEIYGSASDYCVDDDTVYEYFCMNTGYYDTDGEVDCGEGFGCADGACYLIEVAPEGDSSESVCVDSDCGNYVCNPDDKPNCYSQCGSNIECSSGYVCDSGNCVEDISESVIVEVCYDGLDEDEDGLVDCTDDDCFSDSLCLESGNCADGYDNDLDGLEDCADDDCSGDEACVSLSGPSYAAGIEESFLTKFLSWLVFW